MRDWLLSHRWTHLMSEPCIYSYRRDGVFAMLGIYADNLLLACNNTQWVVEFKRLFAQRFKIKDIGDHTKLLGMHIACDRVAKTIRRTSPGTSATCWTSTEWLFAPRLPCP
jgi:hypothetical protein